jgi:hypothetical protein
MSERVCANSDCGASLIGRRSDARFCSDRCRYVAWIEKRADSRDKRLQTATEGDSGHVARRARHDLHDRRVRVSILPEDDALTILAKVEAKRSEASR